MVESTALQAGYRGTPLQVARIDLRGCENVKGYLKRYAKHQAGLRAYSGAMRSPIPIY